MGFPRLQHDDSEEWLDVGLNVGAEGGALYTAAQARSTARTGAGDPQVDKHRFSFAGMSGEFEQHHGTRGRPVVWRGELRVTQLGLRTIQEQRDSFKALEGTFTFIDLDDKEYPNCVIDEFEIFEVEKRTIASDETLDWWVPYKILLTQLVV